jgi:hypothetical protein
MKINIATSYYFEGFFYILGFVMLAIGVYLIAVDYLVVGGIVGAVSIIILTTKYRLLIDTDKKIYKEYLWIAGFENGDEKPFNQLGVVSVKPERYVQRINSIVNNKEIRFTIFAVYIYVDGEELFASEFKKKEQADQKAKALSAKLGTSCYL